MEKAVLKILQDFGYKEQSDDSFQEEDTVPQSPSNRRYCEGKLLKMRKDELKFAAQDLNLSLKGTKNDLVKRIIDHLQNTLTGFKKNRLNEEESNSIQKCRNDFPTKGVNVMLKRCDNGLISSDTETEEEHEARSNIFRSSKFHQSISEDIEVWPETCLEAIGRYPFKTFHNAFKELIKTILEFKENLLHRKQMVLLALILVFIAMTIEKFDFTTNKSSIPYWIGLGILSSVGVGTGLHTFVLFLVPHVALVALSTFRLGSNENLTTSSYKDFLSDDQFGYYQNQTKHTDAFDQLDLVQSYPKLVNAILQVFKTVSMEVFCFALGTALGEVPGYLEARNQRTSKRMLVDKKEDEIEDEVQEDDDCDVGLTNAMVTNLLDKFGFLLVLASASVPNPMFDLIAITCGNFNFSFGKFFAATLTGKVIKVNAQLILLISSIHFNIPQIIMATISQIPFVEKYFNITKKYFISDVASVTLQIQENKIIVDHIPGMLSWTLDKLLMAIILFYILSVVHSFAKSYHQRKTNKKR